MTTLCSGVAALLAVMYIGLIAIVMSYAAMTIEFSQSVRNDEATVASLEAEYLNTVARITNIDYTTVGYTIPMVKVFVPKKSATALR
jgi:acyl-coenzyme A synthetase/AMP-(fatty) acid ligase